MRWNMKILKKIKKKEKNGVKKMILGGLQKITLIDYPGKIATTVFTVGCCFRCPFCHNPELVLSDFSGGLGRGAVKEKDFFDFLKKRKKKLEGVCITGGEPTIQKDIVEFIEKIKKEGFLVKLDTNGTRPDVLKKLFDKKLLDFTAMDIKSSLSGYEKACGVKVDKKRIKLSVDLIKNSRVDYEFRTTVVSGIHLEKDFDLIGRWLGVSRKYVLQRFQYQGKIIDENLRERNKKAKKIDLEKIAEKMKKYFEKVEVRG